ncbi:alpha/beta fold hydrolase [Methylobacterium marchantiae]|uniref:Alpha/beta fold hydrolase n=1 Tax=Methylobacterium marchantiae TaxID=600331 RepID=A0ABW3WYP4_9HYPH|nr:Arylesterase [Methylobacterium marchantiae]
MAFITAPDGTELYYKDWGSGRPVVFLHGWPLDADMWEYQMVPVAEAGFRAVAYDRRGFGRSGQPWSGYDYDTFADDLHAVLESLDLRDATLVGFSMGGGEVVRYLTRHGTARVSQAVLVSAVTPMMLKTPDHPDGVDASVFDDMIDGLRMDRPAFLADFNRGFFGAGMFTSPASTDLMDWAGQIAMLASPKATIACVRAFSETDFRPDMANVTIPCLIIHGDADQTVPIDVTARVTASAVPSAEFVIYDGAPHAIPMTHHERLTTDLVDFLRR